MKNIWLALVILLLGGSTLAAQQPGQNQAPPAQDPRSAELDRLLLRWEQEMGGIKALEAAIVRTKDDKVFRTMEIFEGTARYMQPNLASLQLQRRGNPNVQEAYLCTGAFLYEFDQSKLEVRVHEMPQAKPGEVAPNNFLSFLIGMKALDARKRYDMNLLGDGSDPNYYYLEIIPRLPADKAEFRSAKVALLKSSFLPRTVIFTEANGNVVTWDLPRVDPNAPLQRGNFAPPELKPPWKQVRVPRMDADNKSPGGQEIQPRVVRPKQP